MGPHCSVDQKLKQVGAQHVPVVVVVLVALIAADHQTAEPPVGEQCFVDREIGQIGLHRGAFLRVQWLAGFQSVQRRRRVTGVVGERVGRQARRQVVAHVSTVPGSR